jgi:hypothetical protein
MQNLILILLLLIGSISFSQETAVITDQNSNNTEVTKISHSDYTEYTFKSNHASQTSDIREHLPGFMNKYEHLIDITIDDDKMVHLKVYPEFDENQTLKQILSRFRCPHYTLQSL